MGGYQPREYWADLHKRDDMSAVGQSGLPHELNVWLYRNGARNLAVFLDHAWRVTPARVFDVGAGTGYWVSFWRDRGARVIDGCDLIERAVDQLGAQHAGRFFVADIVDMEPPGDPYDLVSCMNVLLHVTDDASFERALTNIAAFVGPGGALLLAEPIAREASRSGPTVSSRVRTLAAYQAPLESAGLRLAASAPTTVVGANPIERGGIANDFLWPATWRVATFLARRGRLLAGIVGRAIWLLDPLFLALGPAPSGKFALFVRDR